MFFGKFFSVFFNGACVGCGFFSVCCGGGGDVGVGYVPEVEGLGGHGCACRAAVAAVDDALEAVEGQFVASDVDECADDGAHHVAEKSVGCDDEDVGSCVADGMPACMADAADVCFVVGVEFCE